MNFSCLSDLQSIGVLGWPGLSLATNIPLQMSNQQYWFTLMFSSVVYKVERKPFL